MINRNVRWCLIGVVLGILLLTGCSAFTPTPEPPTSTSVPTENPGPQSRSEVPRISPEELKDRLDNGEAILVVDSRSLSSFEMGHIAGAISVPDYEVESRLAEFPRDQEIVFY